MKIRVCHIITQLELGGAQQNTLYTLAHLNPDRFSASLICGQGGPLEADAISGNWTTDLLSSLRRAVHPWHDLRALIQLYKLLRQKRPHIVHTHSSKAGILGRMAAYLAGVPIIVHTFHGFGFTPDQSSLARWLYVSLERFCALLSTHLIFVSEDNRTEGTALGLQARGGESLIRSGIAMARTSLEGVRQELGIPDSSWLIVCVNNFKAQKNPLQLVEIAADVAAADPEIVVVIAGDGELRPAAERWLATRREANRVRLLGWRRDARRLLAAADTYLLTSLWEGLPRALLEAWAEEKPAVAFAVNGVRDVLKDGVNGYAIAPGDRQATVEKLLWLKTHADEARRMGHTGRLLIEFEFEIDRMVRQQEALYEKLYADYPLKDLYEPLWNSGAPA